MVRLSSKNINSIRPTKYLSARWLVPFPILNKFSTHAYHLKLASQLKSIHPVFHISLLEPVKTLKIPNQQQETPPPIIIEEEEELELSQILDSNLKRGRLWFLVEWEGFSQEQERSTWDQLKTSRIVMNLTRISILFILTSHDQILKQLDLLWFLVGRGITKGKSHSWYAPLEVFNPCSISIN
ncbi:hypothetical protein O181_018755 [Austropuccinia psidii MF-1]|uniref:Chromo domain-containing protein n=1 Tax=Austropuccinia psidii MF-1 TaxID=1389203 RepID=A0A9Q3CAF4_9BASI|nr:hypothetical protein [Austropuccinia psidii MF-1]